MKNMLKKTLNIARRINSNRWVVTGESVINCSASHQIKNSCAIATVPPKIHKAIFLMNAIAMCSVVLYLTLTLIMAAMKTLDQETLIITSIVCMLINVACQWSRWKMFKAFATMPNDQELSHAASDSRQPESRSENGPA